MPSYVISGVSRGIGVRPTTTAVCSVYHKRGLLIVYARQYEFLRQYSSDPNNTVIGLVRNKPVTDKKVSEDPDLNHRSNIHILEADITDYKALQVRETGMAGLPSPNEQDSKQLRTRPELPAGASTTSSPTPES